MSLVHLLWNSEKLKLKCKKAINETYSFQIHHTSGHFRCLLSRRRLQGLTTYRADPNGVMTQPQGVVCSTVTRNVPKLPRHPASGHDVTEKYQPRHGMLMNPGDLKVVLAATHRILVCSRSGTAPCRGSASGSPPRGSGWSPAPSGRRRPSRCRRRSACPAASLRKTVCICMTMTEGEHAVPGPMLAQTREKLSLTTQIGVVPSMVFQDLR